MIIVGWMITIITVLAIVALADILLIKKIMNKKYSTHEFCNFWPNSDINFKDFNKKYKETEINDNKLNILFSILEIIYYITLIASLIAAFIFILNLFF